MKNSSKRRDRDHQYSSICSLPCFRDSVVSLLGTSFLFRIQPVCFAQFPFLVSGRQGRATFPVPISVPLPMLVERSLLLSGSRKALLSNEGIYRRWHGLEPLRRKQLISHDVFDPSRYYHWVIFAKSPKMCVLSASRKCLVHLCLIFQMYLRCQHAFPCNDTTFSIILEMH